MNELILDLELFNPVYHELQDALHNNNYRYIWCYGGSSSSKSYSIAQATIVNMLTQGDYNTIVFRKFLSDIKNSIYADFRGIINTWELGQYFELQQNLIICKTTGNYVTFKGLDSEEKIKGIAGFRKVIIDEVNQIEYTDYKQLRLRLRGKKGQQIIGIFNPVSELHWIKTDIFDAEVFTQLDSTIQEKQVNMSGNMLILRTNYLDNHFIIGPQFYDKHTIDSFESDKIKDHNYYNVYALGNWGKLRTGGEYLKNFNTNYHTKELTYDPELPLHITFDENVSPYITCTCWQLRDRELVQIDEILLPDPRNTLQHTCTEFKKRYRKHQAGVFVYGDATSRKQDTKLEKGSNFYTLILSYLEDYHPQLRLNTVNPSVIMSKLFLDAIYNNEYDIRIYIDVNKCKKSIYDYSYALENAEGGIDKKMVTNKLTGVRYQEFGHITDAKKYLVTYLFRNEYQIFLQGGKRFVGKIGKRAIK